MTQNTGWQRCRSGGPCCEVLEIFKNRQSFQHRKLCEVDESGKGELIGYGRSVHVSFLSAFGPCGERAWLLPHKLQWLEDRRGPSNMCIVFQRMCSLLCGPRCRRRCVGTSLTGKGFWKTWRGGVESHWVQRACDAARRVEALIGWGCRRYFVGGHDHLPVL